MKSSFLFKLITESGQNVKLSRYSQFLVNYHIGVKLPNLVCESLSLEGYVNDEEHFIVFA